MGLYTRPDSPSWWMVIEGTSTRSSTGIAHTTGSPEQDKENKRQALKQYAKRQLEAAICDHKPTITFSAFAEWFQAHEVDHHRGADKEASTLRQLGLYFNRFGSLTEIDPDVVKEWMTWRKRQVEPSTVNRELDVLKRLLVAASPKYIAVSPTIGMRRFRTEEREPRVLARDEEKRMLAAGTDEDAAWLMTALDTLMRLSNVVNLKWAQVKFSSQSIIPLNAKVKHDVVPMTARMYAALKALPKDTEWTFPHFHRGDEKKTAAKNRAIRRFDLLCQRANVPHGRAADGVTFHCLRHTGATRALQNGASVRTVMKLGGWQDERSVMRYVHAADSDVRAAAESIGVHAPLTLAK